MIIPYVLVVDDDARTRQLLQKYLNDNGFKACGAENAEAAREELSKFVYDIMVLDVMMPGESGIELTRSLRAMGKQIPILLLTAMGEGQDRINGLEAGADDYLPKPFEPRELILRLNNLAKHIRKEEAEVIKLGDAVFDPGREELSKNGEPVHLTTAELTLLGLLARNHGQLLSREELGKHTGLQHNLRSVDVQITRLRKKIEDDPRLPHYLHTVRGKGYILRID